jgi:hypothetical protein
MFSLKGSVLHERAGPPARECDGDPKILLDRLLYGRGDYAGSLAPLYSSVLSLKDYLPRTTV